MADKKPATNNEAPTTEELDDKSINDLLKEYADDVKDKDIDDFLQDGDDVSDDDAFENDEALMEGAAQPKKSSGGLVGIALLLLLCGGAGAGAWLYLNRADDMTNVMGGFQGNSLPEDDFISTMPAPEFTAPQNDSAAADTMVDTTADTQNTAFDGMFADDLPPPQAITNDVEPVAEAATAPVVAATSAPEAAPVAAQTASKSDEAKPDTAAAVDAWLSGGADTMAEADAKLPPVTEQPVAELKAKPVKIEAADKPRKVTTQPSSAPASDYSPAPRVQNSGAEAALPPPYLAIQARKQGREPGAVAIAAPQAVATTTPVAAPVVDDVAGYVRGSTAATEPTQTRATGVYRDLVASGGGAIELGGDVPVQAAPIAVPPAAAIVAVQQPVQAPVQQTVEYVAPKAPSAPVQSQLAISGGRSVPDGRQVTTSVQTPSRAAPVVSTTQTGSVTVIDDTVVMVPNAVAPAPSQPVPNLPAAPVGTPPASQNPAANLLRDAQAAEKSGRAEQAIALYQRALEADAIHGGGRSIDRGAVYDRIGALRTGR